MKASGIAIRRHHAKRLKKTRAGYWGGFVSKNRKAHSKVVDTPTPCSCWMCGEPRRVHGPTVQEMRQWEGKHRKDGLQGLIDNS